MYIEMSELDYFIVEVAEVNRIIVKCEVCWRTIWEGKMDRSADVKGLVKIALLHTHGA